MITIRDAKPEDAEKLLNIYGYYVEHTAVTFEYDTPSPDEFRERMKTTMQRYPYLVILQDGEIAGYAYAGPFQHREAYDWACETTIYLENRVQKCGMGRRLYEALECALKKMGIRNLYACVAYPEREDEFLTGNSAGFHEHIGYKTVGTFHHCGCKFGKWYHMLWMEKVIGTHDLHPSAIVPYRELHLGNSDSKEV